MRHKQNYLRGYVQVYTGNGKGKTTAALGLALRASGAGARTFIAQFAKGQESSERSALLRFGPQVSLKHYGLKHFIAGKPSKRDRDEARRGLVEAGTALRSGDYQLVILDEGNVAVELGLFTIDELLELIETKPAHVELVITGRNAHPRLIDRADLVTNMVEVKHYYARGVAARRGIET